MMNRGAGALSASFPFFGCLWFDTEKASSITAGDFSTHCSDCH